MSSYVNFYLRVNENFAPIGSWSRSNEIYQVMQYKVPYEKIRPLTSKEISSIIHELEDSAARIERAKAKDQESIKMIMDAANTSLDEKLEAVGQIESNFEEMDAYISEVNFAADTLRVFFNMIDDFKYSDELVFDNDYNHYIYAGIEAYGRMEDVVNENKE